MIFAVILILQRQTSILSQIFFTSLFHTLYSSFSHFNSTDTPREMSFQKSALCFLGTAAQAPNLMRNGIFLSWFALIPFIVSCLGFQEMAKGQCWLFDCGEGMLTPINCDFFSIIDSITLNLRRDTKTDIVFQQQDAAGANENKVQFSKWHQVP